MVQSTLSIILPAKNESIGLSSLIPILIKLYPEAEILVIDDGSTDTTVNISQQLGAKVISHPYSIGNGGAIKTGALNAKGEIIVFMDADGQHNPEDIYRLLEKMKEGYAMVIGARQIDTHASLLRRFGNSFYNRLASMMTGHKIDDLTSGFRVVKAKHFQKILYLLPNGFSYPTTSTMAFFRSALPVAYVPIKAGQRDGKSHIRIIRDGIRFFIIILKIGALFSPMRLFLPISATLFTSGLGYYGYTFINDHRFTNMSALLFSTSVITFLMGILSEQISSLHYKNMEK